ncbi:dynein light chain Tctex-type 1 isoform X1 [Alligator sinensis]|uniref:Dynein light chain Tctex-type 1 isoform X1 n=1 Tax=Alligator sinensis TaxID=38654 RepID=A0A1U8D021_ALLSI|nr:dynein light chain Tctex-type 1 isoform X1 [Alligator sinensis]
MDEFQSGEETAFVVDEVSNIIKEAIEGAIGGNAYQHSKVNQWTTSVVEQTLSQLTKLGKPFKYIGCIAIGVPVIDHDLLHFPNSALVLAHKGFMIRLCCSWVSCTLRPEQITYIG